MRKIETPDVDDADDHAVAISMGLAQVRAADTPLGRSGGKL